jgi:glycosyltransferase involved in cell wall biosynthesis
MRILADAPRIHLLLAGEVRDRRVGRAAEEPGLRDRVHLAGYRKDAPALMGACNVFAMPSLEREGLPRAVIEAMSQGVPPIVSDVGGLPELVVNGHCGMVVPAGNATAIAAAIREYAGNESLCRAHGQSARERIASDFHTSGTIAATLAVYRRVLS